MSDCLFCKIVNGDIKSDKVFENDHILAFNDISPKAPVHILIIPKKHIPTILDLQDSDKWIIGELFSIANSIAKEKGVAEEGFRLVMNCNKNSGQAVFHIHLHLLGGRIFKWPPG